MLSKLAKVASPLQCIALSRSPYSSSLPSSQCLRFLSTTKSHSQSTNKVVFISQSTDIHSNLAFEAWLYKNWCFDRRQLMLLYRNAPCVVIGRHQNPFKEVNLPYLESARVPLARRHSGGGAVYHDHGNLNCSFFSNRKSYNRRWNLELICHSLRSDFNVDVQLNSRDDILLNGKLKVSGSAAKLGRVVAYHHCTLLVNTEHLQLKLALSGDQGMKSTATSSVSSSVGNLASAVSNKHLTVDQVINSVSSHYLEAALPGQHQDPVWHRQQSLGITLVNPQDDWFPGLGEMRDELLSWEWLYGRTPRFCKRVQVPVPAEYQHLLTQHEDQDKPLIVELKCQKGLVEEVTVQTNASRAADSSKDGNTTGIASGSADARAEALAVLQRGLSDVLRGTPYTTQLPAMVNLSLLNQHNHQAAAAPAFAGAAAAAAAAAAAPAAAPSALAAAPAITAHDTDKLKL